MAFNVGNDGADREQPNPGLVRALCIGVVDIGWQAGFQGAITKQVLVLWEIDQRLGRGEHAGKRHLVSRKYKQSMHEKAGLALMLEAWRGQKFADDERKSHDVEQYVNRPCMLNLQMSKDLKYVNVGGVLPMVAGMEPLSRETPEGYLPEWIKRVIEEGKSKPAVEGQEDLPLTKDMPIDDGGMSADPLETRRLKARADFAALIQSGFFPPEVVDQMKAKVAEHKGNIPSIEFLIKGWQVEREAGNATLDKTLF